MAQLEPALGEPLKVTESEGPPPILPGFRVLSVWGEGRWGV